MNCITKTLALALLFSFITNAETLFAQRSTRGSYTRKAKGSYEYQRVEGMQFYIGVGAGLDYGGLGARLEFRPVHYFGIFAGGGYNFNNFGYNIGARIHVLTGHKLQPYFTSMYGYNGVIAVKGAEQYNRTFYGPTIGIGTDIVFGVNKTRFSVAILLPFRDKGFQDEMDDLKRNPSIQFSNEPLPIAISLGFNFWAH